MPFALAGLVSGLAIFAMCQPSGLAAAFLLLSACCRLTIRNLMAAYEACKGNRSSIVIYFRKWTAAARSRYGRLFSGWPAMPASEGEPVSVP
jgi:hypothetical protein